MDHSTYHLLRDMLQIWLHHIALVGLVSLSSHVDSRGSCTFIKVVL